MTKTGDTGRESISLYLLAAVSALVNPYVEASVGNAARFKLYGYGVISLSVITLYPVRRCPALFRSVLFFDLFSIAG